jgi:sugar lactone lactonase YvrE
MKPAFLPDFLRRMLLAIALAGTASAATNYTTPFYFSTLAGATSIGSADGPGNLARFYSPRGVAVDLAGNVYVADTVNQTIRKITPDGTVSTLAGTAGVFSAGIFLSHPMTPQDIDGVGPDAKLANPEGIAVDSAGTVYFADKMVSVIRKVTPAGAVTTWVGTPQAGGSTDGAGNAARFFIPGGLAIDSPGNVYVAEWVTHIIRKITPAGVVTTLAGLANTPGSADGVGSDARFFQPMNLAVDQAGNVIVGDSGNCTVRKITPNGIVTTIAGQPGVRGSADGTGSAARFDYPSGIAVDSAGNIYVSDQGNNTLRKITSAGVVTTLAGSVGAAGSTDGVGSAARFRSLCGLATDAAGNIYGADTQDNTIRKITPAGIVTTLAGLGLDYAIGNNDGTVGLARFQTATQVAAGPAGTVIVSDTLNHTIRQISASGLVTTVAGSSTAFSGNNEDGAASEARFSAPGPIAVDAGGTIYVGEMSNGTIRMISPARVVSTLDPVGPGYTQFAGIGGIATDSAGGIYVTDNHQHTINKISLAGKITVLAGSPGVAGSDDGSASAARFNQPAGLVADSAGNLFVADTGNDTIRRIAPTGVVTTVAGAAGIDGSDDGPAAAARFDGPSGISLDAAGNLFVADSTNSVIRKITPDGTVSTVAGRPLTSGIADGTGRDARFNNAAVVSVDATGGVLVSNASTIQKGRLAGPPVISTQPASQAATVGSGVQFTVAAGGAPAPTYQWSFNGKTLDGATSSTLNLVAARASDAGDYTVVVANPIGSITSAKATLTVTASSTPPPANSPGGSGGAGGGGSIEAWFALSLLALGATRGGRNWILRVFRGSRGKTTS